MSGESVGPCADSPKLRPVVGLTSASIDLLTCLATIGMLENVVKISDPVKHTCTFVSQYVTVYKVEVKFRYQRGVPISPSSLKQVRSTAIHKSETYVAIVSGKPRIC